MELTVLVVDDEPANIDLVKGILPEEFKVKAALKGEIALKLLSKQVPDLVLLDLVMPGLSGFETLQQIRLLPNGHEIPVVIISGNASDSDLDKGKELGAIAHLMKPIDPNQLLTIIKSL